MKKALLENQRSEKFTPSTTPLFAPFTLVDKRKRTK